MTPLALLALLILAAYRLVRLWRSDAVTARLRERFYDRFPPTWQRGQMRSTKTMEGVALTQRGDPRGPSWIGKLMDCPWCLGWWVSCALVAAVWAMQGLPLPLLWPLAVSTGVGVVARVGG